MNHKSARQYSDQMYCSHCQRTWDVNDPEPPPCAGTSTYRIPLEYLNNDKRTTALVGLLTAKLALYEPDCPTVKEALEWLRDARS